MKKYIFLILTLSVFILACSSDNSTKEKTEKQSYQLTKDELLKKEQKNPQDFITVTGYNKKNILGQTVVKGTLVNKASIAIFKDVEIKLSFYSKTQTLLETDKETEYISIGPGESKDFKTKYFTPKGTDSVALQVLGAKVVQQ
ncbi:MAG TPA: hypothetical protein VFI29_00940 [Hanamia sp.]|nr:hypothetical protein [Hanamia sp.]